MEKVNLGIFALSAAPLTLDLNLADERSDGADGIGNVEESCHWQAGVRKSRVDALTDGPYFLLTRQGAQGMHNKIRQHVVELADQTLIRAENDRANRSRRPAFPLGDGRGPILTDARGQSEFHGAIIVAQRADRRLVLSNVRGGQSLHRADH